VNREAQIIRTSADGRRCIAVDVATAQEILAFIGQSQRFKNKFEDIVNVILGGHRLRDLYDKEDIDEKSKDIRAMKFFKGQENGRIYCKEISIADKRCVVIMAAVQPKKKTNKNSVREINLIRSVAGYQYTKIHERK